MNLFLIKPTKILFNLILFTLYTLSLYPRIPIPYRLFQIFGELKISDYDLDNDARREKFKNDYFILCEKCVQIFYYNSYCNYFYYCKYCCYNETNKEERNR